MFLEFRYRLEYLALRTALGLINGLKPGQSAAVFAGIADMYYALSPSRKRTARKNVKKSGIAVENSDINRIARHSFRSFGILIAESLKCRSVLDEQNWRDYVEISIPPSTMSLLKEPGKGVILVSGHLGNWEVAAQLLSFIKPVVGITRGMNNPYTNRLMEKHKPHNRFRLEPKYAADPVRFISALKAGEILAVLMDQYARDRGMYIDFFGRPASTHKMPALLHLVTGTPLVFGYCVRKGPLKYAFNASEPIVKKKSGNKENDIREILEELVSRLEDAIRMYPEQYLWAHRRWRESDP